MADEIWNEHLSPKVPVSVLQAQLRRLLRVRQELVNAGDRVPLELDDKIHDIRKALGNEEGKK